MMKRRITAFTMAFLMLFGVTPAQTTVTVTVDDEDISNNLDLYGIAYIFGEAEDLADFEARINSEDAQISNLDLNGDGQVDYLRVVEAVEDDMHVIIIQAVLAEDLYQDVATVLVDKETTTQSVSVQIVGDPYIYGEDYIIEPVYVTTPVIYATFWRPAYRCYISPYYWGYYPSYFYYRPCVGVDVYLYNMHRFRRAHYAHMSFHYADKPRRNYTKAHATISRKGYATRHPNKSFSARNNGVANKRVADAKRVSGNTRKPVTTRTSSGNKTAVSTGRTSTATRTSTSGSATRTSTGSTSRTSNSKTGSTTRTSNSNTGSTTRTSTGSTSSTTRTSTGSNRTSTSTTRNSTTATTNSRTSTTSSSAKSTAKSGSTTTRSSSASTRKSQKAAKKSSSTRSSSSSSSGRSSTTSSR